MGGQIWVHSEPGIGAQFHFTVPVKRPQSQVNIANPAPPELLHRVKVVVVDENSTNQRILLAMLARWSMRHSAVDGGPQALRALQAARDSGAPFQLILTDMHMPNMDGFDLVAHIREHPISPPLPS
jgi:two-component system sensor histidine kinase/response regulator